MNRFKKSISIVFSLVVISLITFQSCKKELEINADYKAYPIIYGFLNQYDSLQLIKINKSFLGTENPSGYAGIQDSALFDQVDVRIVELHNGIEQNSYPLQKFTLNNKEPGIFSNPENVVYGVNLPAVDKLGIKFLNESTIQSGAVTNRVTYKLEGTLNSDINISAEMTTIPETPEAFYQQEAFRSRWRPGSVSKITFATSKNLTTGIVFNDIKIPPFVKIAEMRLIFNYVDVLKSGDTLRKSFEASMGTVIVPKTSETKDYKRDFSMNSSRFFELVAFNVPDFDATQLKERIPGPMDFKIILGDENYYYYRENTLPSDDLNQTKPQFGNISNGHGIFVSRMILKMSDWAIGTIKDINTISGMPGLNLNRTTQEALNRGYIETNENGLIELGTAIKGFCISPIVSNSTSQRCSGEY